MEGEGGGVGGWGGAGGVFNMVCGEMDMEND